MNARLTGLAALLILFSALFLAWGLRAPMDVILSLRATKLAALLVVGGAAGVATVLFQTVAANRLLTPGIVGFDALYIFVQTALILTLGGAGFSTLPSLPQFLTETALLVAAGLALFGVLLRRGGEDVLRMILTGVILGVFLRGLTSFAQRLLDPSEFAVVQQASFVTFGAVDRTQLAITGAVFALGLIAARALAPALDVAGLGRTTARSLGLDHDRTLYAALALVAVLVAVSTALVGPITFLGLLAASLAHATMGTYRHAVLLPASAMIGAAILVAGQFVFERLLGLQSTLAVIVEFLGGAVFLILVLRRSQR